MSRLQLPAYGRLLLAERRAGRHPLDVNLCFGSLWRLVPAPKVAVMPAEFVPGRYDWSCLTGVCVTVFVQSPIDWQLNIVTNHRGALYAAHFAQLCGELTEADAFVIINAPCVIDGRVTTRREMLLEMTARLASLHCQAATAAPEWPSWWSADLQKKQEMAAAAHLHDIEKARGGEK